MEKPKINITVSPDDFVVCECGSNIYTQISHVACKKNPLIGQPDLCAHIPSGYQCALCCKLLVKNKIRDKTDEIINDAISNS